MPSVEVSAPVSSVASERLVLGVGWVRPGAAGLGGVSVAPQTANPRLCFGVLFCFEGNEE
jgi:hypothetical protein